MNTIYLTSGSNTKHRLNMELDLQSLFGLRVHSSKLLDEDTKELDVYETVFARNLKGLVAIAIAIAIRKKRHAAAEPAIQFSETPPRRERARERCSRLETPPPLPPPLLCIYLSF